MRADLHTHTKASPDSWIPPAKLALVAKRAGMDAVAVTDHNVAGAWEEVIEGARAAGIIAVPGEEVSVKPAGRTVGEIIGLFMNERVDGNGKGAHEIVDLLKRQDALVVLPHPFDSFRKILPEGELRELAVKVDAVEVFNPRTVNPAFNEKAAAFALEYGLAQVGGSDAHSVREVGSGFTGLDALDEEGMRKAIRSKKTRACGEYGNILFAKMASRSRKILSDVSRVLGVRKKRG